MPGQGFIDGLPWFKDGLPVFGSGQGCGGEFLTCGNYVTQFVADHPDPLVTVPAFTNTGAYDCHQQYFCGPSLADECFTDDPCTWIPGTYSMIRAFGVYQWTFLLSDAAVDEDNKGGTIACYNPPSVQRLRASALILGITCGNDGQFFLDAFAGISGIGEGDFPFGGNSSVVIAWRKREYIGPDNTLLSTALPPTVLPWLQEAEAWDTACDGRNDLLVDW